MSNLNTIREKAYQQEPELAAMTDFLMQHDKKLKQLHKQYQKDTKVEMDYLAFVDYVYHNAQDLVINPENN